MISHLLGKVKNTGKDQLEEVVISDVRNYVQESQALINTATMISAESESLADHALSVVNPKLGNSEDMGLFKTLVISLLRSITYALIEGEKEVIDDRFLSGFHEFIQASEHEISWYVNALLCIKDDILPQIQGDSKKKVEEYIDYILEALS